MISERSVNCTFDQLTRLHAKHGRAADSPWAAVAAAGEALDLRDHPPSSARLSLTNKDRAVTAGWVFADVRVGPAGWHPALAVHHDSGGRRGTAVFAGYVPAVGRHGAVVTAYKALPRRTAVSDWRDELVLAVQVAWSCDLTAGAAALRRAAAFLPPAELAVLWMLRAGRLGLLPWTKLGTLLHREFDPKTDTALDVLAGFGRVAALRPAVHQLVPAWRFAHVVLKDTPKEKETR